MARRPSAKAARKKDAKRQRAAEKRAERLRARAASPQCTTQIAAARLTALRAAISRGEAPAPRGLVNLGNTCFFNSVMQCLARVSQFRDYFVGRPPSPGEGPMTTALRAFLVDMWRVDDASVYNPNKLFAELGKCNPSFKGRAQQDSHEAMKVVFDAVVEEEKARLTKVAKGWLPVSKDVCDPDSSSENSQKSIRSPDNSTDDISPTLENSRPDSAIPLSGQNPGTTDLSCPAKEDQALFSDDAAANRPNVESEPGNDSVDTEDPDEEEEEKPVPPGSLISIIERTVGGVLSSTILCKECSTKSSVSEPFMDLQVPLVPKNENEVKVGVKDIEKLEESKSEKAVQDKTSVLSGEEVKEESPAAEGVQTGGLVVYGPAAMPPPLPPPPPPPPPPAPRSCPSSSTSVVASCDVFKELRQNVRKTEAEEEVVPERQVVVVPMADINAGASSGDDVKAIFDDDDDDVEGYGLSSLFETDFGGEDDISADDVNNMTAFSMSEAAQEPTTAGTAASPEKKPPAPVAPASRRAPSFISSIFGGFGVLSPAPHGYRSVVGSLEEFTKVEVLEGDNAYGCEECTRREKLRIALQHRGRQTVPVKKIEASTEHCMDDNLGDDISSDDAGPDDQHVESARMCLREASDGMNRLDEVSKLAADTKANRPCQPVLMSSPVTSSESSSGVNSEDDGELVIEEELEQPTEPKTNCAKSLSREDEDRLIKDLQVDVPTVRTTAEKRFVLKELPNVLTIQLKRFTQVGFRGGLRKISGHVEFPIRLDLSPFVDEGQGDTGSVTRSPKQNVSKRKRTGVCGNETAKSNTLEYILTGVSVHGGSLTGGHYTAYVREGVDPDSRGGWYFCNDSRIQRASERDVLNSEAYLLYYERV